MIELGDTGLDESEGRKERLAVLLKELAKRI